MSAIIDQVPPKLCVALLSDKAMRDTCKGFGLPATGRKEVRFLHQLASSRTWLLVQLAAHQAHHVSALVFGFGWIVSATPYVLSVKVS